MSKYQVSANGTIFGVYEGENEQQARDLCAQDAGYESETDMVAALVEASDLVAVEGDEWEAWEDGGEATSFFHPTMAGDIAEAGALALGVDVSASLNVRKLL